jgi:hypothetical protein
MRASTCRASETGHRLSARPGMGRGEARASQVPGPSSSGVPWANTPPDTPLSSPNSRRGRCGLQVIQHPGHPGRLEVSGPQPHGPHACVPTLRRPRGRDRRQAHDRRGRAHPWPDGFRTRWTTDEVSRSHRILQSPSTSIAWSHCISYTRMPVRPWNVCFSFCTCSMSAPSDRIRHDVYNRLE